MLTARTTPYVQWLLDDEGTQRADGATDPESTLVAMAAYVGLYNCARCRKPYLRFGSPHRQPGTDKIVCPDCRALGIPTYCRECGDPFISKLDDSSPGVPRPLYHMCAECRILSALKPEKRALYIIQQIQDRHGGAGGSRHYRMDPYDGWAGIAYKCWEEDTDHL